MQIIKLTKGFETIVDDEDFKWLNQFKWCINIGGYAVRTVNRKAVFLHRLLNKTPEGFDTDHINRNKLDNRKNNLRAATRQQNSLNTKVGKNNTSGYVGITWNNQNKNWRAQITINNKQINLGSYEHLQAAWLARRWGERIYVSR